VAVLPGTACDIVDAIRYLTHNGPVWRALSADFPPAWTVYYWAARWEADGSAARMHDDLRERTRLAAGRNPGPTAAIIGPAADGAGHRRIRPDRDAAKPLLWNLRRAFPQITLAWADGGYAGKLVTWATTGCA
jgi:transposase